jgi:hypothetical protein
VTPGRPKIISPTPQITIDIHAAVKTWADESGFDMTTPYDIIRGCTLTDQEMDEDAYDVVWKSGNEGWLTDETGSDWLFAVTVA